VSNSNKKKDLPAMPFYIGDWKKDPAIQVLSREDKMIWLEMIFLMWESKERGYLTVNGIPMTNEMLSTALNLDNQNLTKRLSMYEEFGLFSRRESDGAIYSRRIVKIIELSEKRKNVGLLGGNPNLVKQKLSKGKAKGKANAENENENENENEIVVLKDYTVENFEKIPPVYKWVITRAEEMKYPEITDQVKRFYDYYESNGWKVGKNPMKNWAAALSNWYKNYNQFNKNGKQNRNGQSEQVGRSADIII
jgi:hypothetical protein